MTHVRLLYSNRSVFTLAGLTLLLACPRVPAQQFVLFDVTFTFTKEDADNSKPSKSHYYVRGKMLNAERHDARRKTRTAQSSGLRAP